MTWKYKTDLNFLGASGCCWQFPSRPPSGAETQETEGSADTSLQPYPIQPNF